MLCINEKNEVYGLMILDTLKNYGLSGLVWDLDPEKLTPLMQKIKETLEEAQKDLMNQANQEEQVKKTI